MIEGYLLSYSGGIDSAELLHSVQLKIPPLFSAAEETQSADSMTAEHRSCSACRMPRRGHTAFLLSLERIPVRSS